MCCNYLGNLSLDDLAGPRGFIESVFSYLRICVFVFMYCNQDNLSLDELADKGDLLYLCICVFLYLCIAFRTISIWMNWLDKGDFLY